MQKLVLETTAPFQGLPELVACDEGLFAKEGIEIEWADVDEETARDWMRACGAQHLIHGHTHRPRSEPFGIGMRHVLSDWDLDHHAPDRAQVLRFTPDGFERIDLT